MKIENLDTKGLFIETFVRDFEKHFGFSDPNTVELAESVWELKNAQWNKGYERGKYDPYYENCEDEN